MTPWVSCPGHKLISRDHESRTKTSTKLNFTISKKTKDLRSTHNTKVLRSIENLPPGLKKSYQYQRVFKLTPGQNPINGPSFYVVKPKSRLQRLLLYKIIKAHILISSSFKILFQAIYLSTLYNHKLQYYND